MDSKLRAWLGTFDGECLALLLRDARNIIPYRLVKDGFLVFIRYEIVTFWKCLTCGCCRTWWCRIVNFTTARSEYHCCAADQDGGKYQLNNFFHCIVVLSCFALYI